MSKSSEPVKLTEQEKIDVVKALCENLGQGSFRWLIYEVLGLSVESGAYVQLWSLLGPLNNEWPECLEELERLRAHHALNNGSKQAESTDAQSEPVESLEAYLHKFAAKVRADDMSWLPVHIQETQAKLTALIESEKQKARIEELERLSKARWADLAYDVPHYLNDRLKELEAND